MNEEYFTNNFIRWAMEQNDIEALIQFGSRAQPTGLSDKWSDWDFEVICKSPKRYFETDWSSIFGRPCWHKYQRFTNRNIIRASLVFEGGAEVDLIILTAWQIKVLYFLMKYPSIASNFPWLARKGIADLRDILLPGYKVHKGGMGWEKRLEALKIPQLELTKLNESIRELVGKFWFAALTIVKSLNRDDLLYAAEVYHVELRESLYMILILYARKQGKLLCKDSMSKCRTWLPTDIRDKLMIKDGIDKKSLSLALLTDFDILHSTLAEFCRDYQIQQPDYSTLKSWLEKQLELIIHKD